MPHGATVNLQCRKLVHLTIDDTHFSAAKLFEHDFPRLELLSFNNVHGLHCREMVRDRSFSSELLMRPGHLNTLTKLELCGALCIGNQCIVNMVARLIKLQFLNVHIFSISLEIDTYDKIVEICRRRKAYTRLNINFLYASQFGEVLKAIEMNDNRK